MKANELRIGNFIQHKDYKNPVCIQLFLGLTMANVDGAMLNFATDEIYDIELIEYEPIPITEKWLVRFGFERINQQYPHKKIYSLNKFYIKFDIKDSFFYWAVYGANTDYKIELVHQLQNLYIALTGQELELKES